MATTKNISVAMRDTAAKKENLRKAFEDLQSHSSTLASFTLQWKDIEEHFDSIEQSIKEKFEELSEKEKQVAIDRAPAKADKTSAKVDKTPAKENKTPAKTDGKTPASADNKTPAKVDKMITVKIESTETEATPRPELKSLCAKSDAKGLRSYIVNHKTEAGVIRAELPAALRAAPDPASFVLNCMEGFHPLKETKPADINAIRRACTLLLERLAVISPEIKNPVKERAIKLANDWKAKVSMEGDAPLQAQAFLQLLVTYGITSLFKEDELCDIALSIGKRKQTPDLCRALGVTDKMPDFVQKLINKGKQLEAVNFIFAFDLVNKFPPVPLLKSYLKEAKKAAQESLKKGKNSVALQNEATNKELAALREIIKVIDEHKLESQYSRASHDKRIEQLLKERADRKRSNVAANFKTPQQQANKRPRPAPPSETNPAMHSAAQARPVATFGDRAQPQPYLGSGGPYGLSGPGSIYDGLGSSFGSGSGGLNLSGNRSPPHLSGSHLYSSGSLGSGGMYDNPLGYSSSYPLSGLPSSYRSSYYP